MLCFTHHSIKSEDCSFSTTCHLEWKAIMLPTSTTGMGTVWLSFRIAKLVIKRNCLFSSRSKTIIARFVFIVACLAVNCNLQHHCKCLPSPQSKIYCDRYCLGRRLSDMGSKSNVFARDWHTLWVVWSFKIVQKTLNFNLSKDEVCWQQNWFLSYDCWFVTLKQIVASKV